MSESEPISTAAWEETKSRRRSKPSPICGRSAMPSVPRVLAMTMSNGSWVAIGSHFSGDICRHELTFHRFNDSLETFFAPGGCSTRFDVRKILQEVFRRDVPQAEKFDARCVDHLPAEVERIS